MKSKDLEKAVLLVFCFGLLITSVGVGTGVIAKNQENLEESVKKDEKIVSNIDVEKKQKSQKSQKGQKSQNVDTESEKILSRFETTAESAENRNQNLKTACDRLNGAELQPGEILSFNDLAGPFTQEAGYLAGPAILDEGCLGEDVGGGVCQVSTTLYNAALRGNLGIVERHRHTFPMEYVEVGLDAMIHAPDFDLKIQNTTDTVLHIEADAHDGTVVVQFNGTKLDAGTKIQVEGIVLNTLVPEGEEIRLSTELAEGTRQVYREQRNGYETRVYRKVYNNGELVNEEILSEDTYPPLRRIIIEGCQQSK